MNKTDYINETISNTPLPQASSTADRARNSSHKRRQNSLRNNRKKLMDSAKSEGNESSLGLLSPEKLDGAQQELLFTPVSSGLNDSLRKQRELARQTLSRLEGSLTEQSINPFLIPPTPANHRTYQPNASESTFDLSTPSERGELTDAFEKISFQPGEISARSSSLGKLPKTEMGEQSQDFDRNKAVRVNVKSLYNDMAKIIENRDLSVEQICKILQESTDSILKDTKVPKSDLKTSFDDTTTYCSDIDDSLINRLKQELFAPNEKIKDLQVESDAEASTCKDDSKIETSRFSVCSNSSVVRLENGEVMSADQYFQRGCEDLSMFLPNVSPEKKSKAYPLVDESECASASMLGQTTFDHVLKNCSSFNSPSKILNEFKAARKCRMEERHRDNKENFESVEQRQDFFSETPTKYINNVDFSDISRISNVSKPLSSGSSVIDDQKIYPACLNVPTEVYIGVAPGSNKWLRLSVCFEKAVLESSPYEEGEIVKVNASDDILVNPRKKAKVPIQITPLKCGTVKITFNLTLFDMVSKSSLITKHYIYLNVERPMVRINKDQINFELLPEGNTSRIVSTLTNLSQVDLPIILLFDEESTSFGLVDSESSQAVSVLRTLLQVDKPVPLSIELKTPRLRRNEKCIQQLKNNLVILLESTSETILKVPIVAEVGTTAVSFHSSCIPLLLTPGDTKAIQIKNEGLVNMKFSLSVKNSLAKCMDDIVILDQANLLLLAGSTATVNVSLREYFDGNRYVVFEHPGEPSFSCTLVCGKEHPLNAQERPSSAMSQSSLASARTQSSTGTTLRSLESGKLPISTSKLTLSFGCKEIGKSETQKLVIRNDASQKIRVQIMTSSNSFYIISDQEKVTKTVITLQAKESRTILVSFTPNKIGAAVGRLMFSAHSGGQSRYVSLLGYGGHCTLKIENVTLDLSGKILLQLDNIESQEVVRKSFYIKNAGNLPSFAKLEVDFDRFSIFPNCIKLDPSEVILNPQEEKLIHVDFYPKKAFVFLDDKNGKEVLQVATIILVFGPEATRGRLRKIMVDSNMPINNSLVKICKNFPGENMPNDIGMFTEKSSAAKSLICELTKKELIVTVKRDLEHVYLNSDMSETCFFQSLCNETVVEIPDENGANGTN